MRVLVVGAGAIGGYFGGRLLAAGFRVSHSPMSKPTRVGGDEARPPRQRPPSAAQPFAHSVLKSA